MLRDCTINSLRSKAGQGQGPEGLSISEKHRVCEAEIQEQWRKDWEEGPYRPSTPSPCLPLPGSPAPVPCALFDRQRFKDLLLPSSARHPLHSQAKPRPSQRSRLVLNLTGCTYPPLSPRPRLQSLSQLPQLHRRLSTAQPPSPPPPSSPAPSEPAPPTCAHLAQPAGERAEAHGVEEHRVRRPPRADADADGGQLGARPGQ